MLFPYSYQAENRILTDCELGPEFVATLWCNMRFLSLSLSLALSCARVSLFLSLFASTPGSFVHCLECGCESDPELVMEYPGSLVVLM